MTITMFFKENLEIYFEITLIQFSQCQNSVQNVNLTSLIRTSVMLILLVGLLRTCTVNSL